MPGCAGYPDGAVNLAQGVTLDTVFAERHRHVRVYYVCVRARAQVHVRIPLM